MIHPISILEIEEDVVENSSILAAYNTFIRYLEQIRCRLTQPRLQVARTLLEIDHIFDEEDVNNWIREKGKPIGPRSVSKTLQLLVKCGLLAEIKQGEEVFYLSLAQFAPGTLCMLCIDCLNVITAMTSLRNQQARAVAKEHGYEMACAFHVVRGRCRQCHEAVQPMKRKAS